MRLVYAALLNRTLAEKNHMCRCVIGSLAHLLGIMYVSTPMRNNLILLIRLFNDMVVVKVSMNRGITAIQKWTRLYTKAS